MKKLVVVMLLLTVLVIIAWSQSVNGNLGETLNLRGPVDGLTGNREVRSLGISGLIVGGQLNYTIDTPSDEHLHPIEDAFSYVLWQSEGTRFSDTTARAAGLYLSIGSGASIARATPDFGILVYYFYVDRDVTISRGHVQGVNAFNLPLKKGWNAILRIDFTTYSLGDREDLSWSISQDM